MAFERTRRVRRTLSFERALQLWLTGLGVPVVALASGFTWAESHAWLATAAAALLAALVWAVATATLYERIVRPLQTLTNVVAALRADDYTFRARGARRGDSLGDLAFEINALAGSLQRQSSSARDALTLTELVMNSMQTPILAFDRSTRLHLMNAAAERVFGVTRTHGVNRLAADLRMETLLRTPDQGLYEPGSQGQAALHSMPDARWVVRRTSFRLHGVPHILFVLADVSAALREEERLAWQRLIRVLGHEINNSLTPIKSIAGSLRQRLPLPGPESSAEYDFDRGLSVIENRADSLNRFLHAYQQLFRLPAPRLGATALTPLMHQVAELETRLKVIVADGPPLTLLADADQLQQLLINLIRNATDSALGVPAAEERQPWVEVAWQALPQQILIQVLDNGTGLASSANLFVPFYTTKPEGTGIGLILAQQIAHAHHGSVTLRNRPDPPGCVAEVILPR